MGLVDEAYKVLAFLQDEIVRLNTQEQLLEGVDSTGKKITPKYKRRRYAVAKNRINPKAGLGTPDFKVKGDFYKGFYVKPIKDNKASFEIDSSDFKTEFIVKRSGKEVFGLTADHEGIINEQAKVKLFEWVLENLKI